MQEGGGDHPREQGSRPLAFVTSSLRTARQPAVGHRGHHEETPPAAPGWGCWTLERPPGNVPANPASLCPLSPGVHPPPHPHLPLIPAETPTHPHPPRPAHCGHPQSGAAASEFTGQSLVPPRSERGPENRDSKKDDVAKTPRRGPMGHAEVARATLRSHSVAGALHK